MRHKQKPNIIQHFYMESSPPPNMHLIQVDVPHITNLWESDFLPLYRPSAACWYKRAFFTQKMRSNTVTQFQPVVRNVTLRKRMSLHHFVNTTCFS